MSSVSRTIVLRGDLHRWHDEAYVDTTRCKPGFLIEKKSNGKVQPHSSRGGKSTRYFAKEDDLRGGTIDGTLQYGELYYVDGDLCLFHKAQSGDKINAVLQMGESVVIGDYAISFGNGKVCKAASAYLANNLTSSTNVTNLTAETTFSTGTVTVPKNSVSAGDILRIRAQGICPSTNSTDTLVVKLKIGSTVIVTTATLDVANNDIFYIDATVLFTAVGASGTIQAMGTNTIGPPATATVKAFNLASTAIDTTANMSITVTATWSVASASNQVALTMLTVEKVNGVAGGTGTGAVGDIIGQFQEVLDLSVAVADNFCAVEIMW